MNSNTCDWAGKTTGAALWARLAGHSSHISVEKGGQVSRNCTHRAEKCSGNHVTGTLCLSIRRPPKRPRVYVYETGLFLPYAPCSRQRRHIKDDNFQSSHAASSSSTYRRSWNNVRRSDKCRLGGSSQFYKRGKYQGYSPFPISRF